MTEKNALKIKIQNISNARKNINTKYIYKSLFLLRGNVASVVDMYSLDGTNLWYCNLNIPRNGTVRYAK